MRSRPFLLALAIPLFLAGGLRAQSGIKFFPLSEVRPGMKGVGRTIFQGNRVENFQVEILGVLRNALAPKQDVILARLSGGPLDKTGVIAGMSGSPVYVDGKLLGAVALSFQFAKEPITGITPIEQMLSVTPRADQPGRSIAALFPYHLVSVGNDPQGSVRMIPTTPDGVVSLSDMEKVLRSGRPGQGFSDLRLPLSFGGFSQDLIQTYAPLLRRLGFEPMRGGVLSGGEAASPAGEPEPGDMISMFLMRGDLNLNVDCTVTYRTGKDLYACGHQLLLSGPAQIPFARAEVLATVPDLLSSFKVDAPGPLAGSIRQDRFGAIFGVVGEKAPMIPIHLQVASTLNKTADYHFSILEHGFLSPLLLNLGIVASLNSTERAIGPSTLDLKGAIRLAGGEAVHIEDVISANVNTSNAAGAAVATPLTYLLESGFPNLKVEGVDLSVGVKDVLNVATLEQVWSTKSEVHPGDHLSVVGLLRTSSGKSATLQIPVTVPESVSDPILSLAVGSGSSLNLLQNAFGPLGQKARDLSQLVRALNRMRRNNRLYALLMSPQNSVTLEGQEYPSPPPSLMQTFLADPAVSSGVIFSGSSIVGDFETSPTAYTIQGEKTLLLKVDMP